MKARNENLTRFCGIDALDDHLNLIHRLLHRSALADQVSGFPVPAVNGSTRYNQVADTGKTVEGFRMGTHRRAEPCNFRDPAGNQSRFRIVAVAKTIRRSGCQCDDIFYFLYSFAHTCVPAG